MHNSTFNDTICALATPPGIGAIAVLRVSGPETFSIVERLFHGHRGDKKLSAQPSHTLHYGTLRDGEIIVDEVLVSLFKAPRSYTREDVIEISCHGSEFIVQRILRLLLQNGCRLAQPGEFTQRAFLNGQLDLAQAEAVADLIASDSEAAHRAAIHQIRGGFSKDIALLREQLISFASLIELELDFAEEDVEFAQRDDLKGLVTQIQGVLRPLIDSFVVGNVVKNGVPTVIAGKPNAGKSTLLNALLKEEKAIVSDIPGTTRDVIEDELIYNGIRFRLIDTAGLREATDAIEAIGVARTHQQLDKAAVIVYLFDASELPIDELKTIDDELKTRGTPYLLAANKVDKVSPDYLHSLIHTFPHSLIPLQANAGRGLDELLQKLAGFVKTDLTNATIVTNLRHFEHLVQTADALDRVLAGLEAGITQDWLALDIRQALYHLGAITGQITTDDLLATIFSKFCIGK
ncbi:MAG: tRNA uridine-5-carboxymethylaminomethyl(34) synthesis GTPase MnmE [Cytophagaceae bacterium]|nr:tRNA uridine-5-carboxymethylaminomethyl(34) synthesis GTPase MnmE [Cytophagaceae bacterium]